MKTPETRLFEYFSNMDRVKRAKYWQRLLLKRLNNNNKPKNELDKLHEEIISSIVNMEHDISKNLNRK